MRLRMRRVRPEHLESGFDSVERMYERLRHGTGRCPGEHVPHLSGQKALSITSRRSARRGSSSCTPRPAAASQSGTHRV